MHIVFLAAGKGSRIFHKIKTNKCLIKLNKKTIIEHLIENIPKKNRDKISIVTGFNRNGLHKVLKKYKPNFIHNKNFYKTEMVESLRIALIKINDDILFSYSDIIYDKKIIHYFTNKKLNKIALPIKIDWKKVWKIRNKPIYGDAESLVVKNNFITEIGNKIEDFKNVHGQFMGLIYIPKKIRLKILYKLKNKKYKKLQTTKFINNLIEENFKVKAINRRDHWYEFDDIEDLVNYKKKYKYK